MSRRLLALVPLAAALLTGCTYTVEVTNLGEEGVTVRMLQTDPVFEDWMLPGTEERLSPGEKIVLGPKRVSMARVYLEADSPDRPDVSQRVRLRAGLTRFTVRVDPEGDRRRLVIDRVD